MLRELDIIGFFRGVDDAVGALFERCFELYTISWCRGFPIVLPVSPKVLCR